jgi:predicted nuclease of predicted toxin-antitoxin system
MRLLVDECTSPAVARWLREQNHDVFSVFEQGRGMDDDKVIQKAFVGKKNAWLPLEAKRDETGWAVILW